GTSSRRARAPPRPARCSRTPRAGRRSTRRPRARPATRTPARSPRDGRSPGAGADGRARPSAGSRYPRAVPTGSDCLFCKIVAGELPATIVAEDERTIAFMDINPATRGHALVIPRAHAADLHAIGAEDLTACALAAQRLAVRMRERLG